MATESTRSYHSTAVQLSFDQQKLMETQELIHSVLSRQDLAHNCNSASLPYYCHNVGCFDAGACQCPPSSKACQSSLHFSLIMKYFTLHFIHFTEFLSKINNVRYLGINYKLTKFSPFYYKSLSQARPQFSSFYWRKLPCFLTWNL